MDPIFDFILEGEPQSHNKDSISKVRGDNPPNIPGSPTSCPSLDLCEPSSPSIASSPSQQNEIEEINDEYISSVASNGQPISAPVRDTSIALIEEYLQDSISLKLFLQKVFQYCLMCVCFHGILLYLPAL